MKSIVFGWIKTHNKARLCLIFIVRHLLFLKRKTEEQWSYTSSISRTRITTIKIDENNEKLILNALNQILACTDDLLRASEIEIRNNTKILTQIAK